VRVEHTRRDVKGQRSSRQIRSSALISNYVLWLIWSHARHKTVRAVHY